MLVISGGQSGADIAGVMGAFGVGHACLFIAFQGFRPEGRDRLPEIIPYKDAVMPVWATSYAQKLLARTQHNVEAADATIILLDKDRIEQTVGSRRTLEHAQKVGRPHLVLDVRGPQNALVQQISEWVESVKPDCLNIAGTRTCDERVVSEIFLRVK